MVLKVFDVFSESTRIFITLLSRCFKEWMLYKPALSRPCNSERYFLGRGFRGITPAILQTFQELQRQAAVGVVPIGIQRIATPEELAYFEAHTARNTAEQLQALKTAETYLKDPASWYGRQMAEDFKTSQRWCSEFQVPVQQQRPPVLSVADPFPATRPARGRGRSTATDARRPSECTSEPGAAPQSQLPGADSESHRPDGPASQASS